MLACSLLPKTAPTIPELAKLFDHLVGDREYGKTERLGSLSIDDKIKFGRLLDLVLAPCGAAIRDAI
jgi:hypothetical protein